MPYKERSLNRRPAEWASETAKSLLGSKTKQTQMTADEKMRMTADKLSAEICLEVNLRKFASKVGRY